MATFPLSPKAIAEVRKARAAGFKVQFVDKPAKIDPTCAKLGWVRVATWAVDALTTVTLDANGGLGRITKHAHVEPPAGSWAATARMMADGDDSGFDWDAWKDEMKERDWEEDTGGGHGQLARRSALT